ncbi:MAG: hypothetical protein ACOCUO_00890 [archaeon]
MIDDLEVGAAAAARNATPVPDIVLKGQRLGICDDCGSKFEYGIQSTGIGAFDPCPDCGSFEWSKWGYRFEGEDVPNEDIDYGSETA